MSTAGQNKIIKKQFLERKEQSLLTQQSATAKEQKELVELAKHRAPAADSSTWSCKKRQTRLRDVSRIIYNMLRKC